jgi:hypothetical protein
VQRNPRQRALSSHPLCARTRSLTIAAAPASAPAQEEAEAASKAAASRPTVVHAVPLFLRDSGEDAAAGDAEGRRPEDSVYFHPQLNPYGAPPPGRPQKWKTVGTAGARLALVRVCCVCCVLR